MNWNEMWHKKIRVCVCSFVCRETNFDVSQYLLKNKSKTERGKYKYTFSEQ